MYIAEPLSRILRGDTRQVTEVTDGYKKLINQSGLTLTVLLITRVGSEPNQSGQIVATALPVSGKQTIVRQCAESLPQRARDFLIFRWRVFERVADRDDSGSSWDTVLNTHDTLTFSGAGGLNVVGSNI